MKNLEGNGPAEQVHNCKLGELKNMLAALGILANLDLPAVIAFRIGKIVQQSNEIIDVYSKALEKAQKSFAEVGEPGDELKFFSSEAEVDYKAQFAELNDEAVEIKFKPIPLEGFAGVQVKPVVFAALMWLFEEM